MSSALSAAGLSRRYGKTWALHECSLEVPAGSVTALVGPNGAGKTTLLEIAVGILEPTEGEIRLLGTPMRGQTPSLLSRIGFVAQDAPLYRNFTVLDMLQVGRHLNPRWDDALARDRLRRLRIPRNRVCGQLSGGQQAQVALTLAVAKRPELLILDEPVARLDPLARREFLESLMEIVADGGLTVLLSSHLISDLERVSDQLILLSEGTVLLAGSTEDLLAEHAVLSGPRHNVEAVAARCQLIDARATGTHATVVVRRLEGPVDPRLTVDAVDLEELVLAYLRRRPAPLNAAEPVLVGGVS
ncbi:MAG: ATP-binding cassette domain-containing protein [Candidatus Dormibacteraeota bacterium]|nr:ATP-binding cassette domain-containing protein [Candidatus Dormibacteraeota bacterium]MBV9525567.1 ATP-binding cassette domain-containing protein [Candidatus Dormibacteraeota bacterium]